MTAVFGFEWAERWLRKLWPAVVVGGSKYVSARRHTKKAREYTSRTPARHPHVMKLFVPSVAALFNQD